MTACHDVIIIGAGPGGSAAAHFLAQAGLDVLLLDKACFPRDKTCGDGLTPRAVHMLERIGVASALARRACRMERATVFGPAGRPVTTQMPDHPELPGYMMVVPRLELDDCLRQHAVHSGARFQDGVHISAVSQEKSHITVTGNHRGTSFSARGRTGIVAVGANTRLLQTLGILKRPPRMILAARAYYEGLAPRSTEFEFHFDGIPLPGYGWLFPLSATEANIGAGVMPSGHDSRRSAKQVLATFIELPALRDRLRHARRVGPVKGFPIRTDFATAPTHHGRLLLVGEAAGLVNPLTGEGIDFALESGAIAADHLLNCFRRSDLAQLRLRLYEDRLRARFQRLFIFSGRIRDYYLHAPILNRLVYVANKRSSLRALFTDIVLGNDDAGKAMSIKTMAQILFTL